MTSWEFEIRFPTVTRRTGKIETLMPIYGNDRVHWGQRSAVTSAIREHFAIEALKDRLEWGAPEATGRRALLMTLVRGFGQHALDRDNVVSLLKPCLDALCPPRKGKNQAPWSGWLLGDSDTWVDYLMPRQDLTRRFDGPAVTYLVEEL